MLVWLQELGKEMIACEEKTIIQLTAALAAVGLVMIGVDRNTSKVAFAAFEGVEGSSEL